MGVLDGKVALVTGAGQGVGRGIALAMASAGARLVVTGRVDDKLVAVAKEIADRGSSAVPLVCDGKIGSQIAATVAAAVAEFGTIDILVNNAQQTILGPILDLTDEQYEHSWQSGPMAALRYMRACYPQLKGGGVVLNLGSASALNPQSGFSAYGSVKNAMLSVTRYAAIEWGADDIRVNALLPLAMSEAMVSWAAVDPAGFERVNSAVPLRRIGDCEADIGRAAVFLCGPDSAYITGTTLMVDGGQTWLR
jgi:meso-butanediol dehydrogenase / (S,S)-butanediol dehydrogenase / diacetyl reductase